ncbi:hypothetical protein EDB92DRAFT_2091885 [Lactarius akahatsu]|uniref:Uncharacterized protein n=1 Tax=Lactarius akahatsu TaxID=416441 RepID=A0AAD4QAI2_9AGAM|nr:hypothetical protein EDB92DRAFT_2091885 [Lactarius akahatsu]
MHSFSLLSLVVLHHLVICVRADASIFIPGFDPQPLSAGELGTDGQGRTTWEIVPGTPTGTLDEAAFVGTATLVEGPNDAHLVYNNAQMSVTLDIQCGITSGFAACTGDAGYGVTPFIFPTNAVQPILVQGGGPLTASPATPSSNSVLSPASTSSTSSASSVPNDARSNIVVQIPLVMIFAVIGTVVLL